METCVPFTDLLTRFSAAGNVIVPGFGVTETCSGVKYNLAYPTYDIQNQRAFTSLRKCIPGVEMRVSRPSVNETITLSKSKGPANLEVRGSAVFDGYYNNVKAIAEALIQMAGSAL